MLELAPQLAASFLRELVASTRPLKQFPTMGRVHPDLEDENIREIIHRDYRIAYAIERDDVFILSVLHGAMDVRTRIRRQLGDP